MELHYRWLSSAFAHLFVNVGIHHVVEQRKNYST